MQTKAATAFSLIELLTLIAITAILASIAAPNFLESQTRSNISRANADLRAISTALEIYHVETNKYPLSTTGNPALAYGAGRNTNGTNTPTLERLTTPISYLASSQSFLDPFDPNGLWSGATQIQQASLPRFPDGRPIKLYWYSARNQRVSAVWLENTLQNGDPSWWFLQSSGPDRKFNYVEDMLNSIRSDTSLNRSMCARLIYDPTNGTTSYGGIWHFGGDPSGCWGSSFYYVAAKVKYED
jgi:type II secretory pathway pseudopilin PulG